VTAAAQAGVPERVIMQQTGHTDVRMLRRYIHDSSLFRENAAGIGCMTTQTCPSYFLILNFMSVRHHLSTPLDLAIFASQVGFAREALLFF